MTINQKPPSGSRESLIERAASIYGLRDSVLAKPAAVPSPAPMAPPAAPPDSEAVQAPAMPAMEPLAAPQVLAPEPPLAAPTPAAAIQPPPVVEQTPVLAQPVAFEAQPAHPARPVAPQAPMAPSYSAPPVWEGREQKIVPIDPNFLKQSGLIIPGAPPTMLSEEFRLVKRQLLMQAFGSQTVNALERGRQILVCSAQPNEGKTYSSVNLALSMASETDADVLLVDADVAKPEVLSTLGLPAGPGLMDALADPSIDPEGLILRTSIPGLSVLPAGRQTNNDTELLASPHSRAVLDGLATARPNRIVIFDSAPALAASPASVLALNVGQIVLVVRADSTSESELREALAMLEGNARIQLLLNNVTFSGSNRKFGYYYGLGEK